MVHKESLALAEDWLKDLPYGSLLNRNNPLVDRTIDRYRDEVVGRPVENRRKVQPQVPLLEFWAKLAPGEPIWAMQREQWLEWVHGVIRDGHGTGTKEPSESQVNNRRSSSKNFVTWMGVRRGLAVDQRIVIYQPAPEDRVEARRKQVSITKSGITHAGSGQKGHALCCPCEQHSLHLLAHTRAWRPASTASF